MNTLKRAIMKEINEYKFENFVTDECEIEVATKCVGMVIVWLRNRRFGEFDTVNGRFVSICV